MNIGITDEIRDAVEKVLNDFLICLNEGEFLTSFKLIEKLNNNNNYLVEFIRNQEKAAQKNMLEAINTEVLISELNRRGVISVNWSDLSPLSNLPTQKF